MSERHLRVAIIGSGILGVLSALELARAGCSVTLFERDPLLWNGASRAGEGKVHLGLIYPLGSDNTRNFMLHGALTFTPIIDRLTDGSVDWLQIVSPTFSNVVMPESLLSVDELATSYAEHQRRFLVATQTHGSEYLGSSIQQIVDPQPYVHKITGHYAFHTAERAVNPETLRAVLLDAAAAEGRIETFLSAEVTSVSQGYQEARVQWHESTSQFERSFDAVVNCAWQEQARFVRAGAINGNNIRFKTAIRIPREFVETSRCDTVTMVVGPFGDVVAHEDFVYVSWYPIAKVGQEQSALPSQRFLKRVSETLASSSHVDRQIEAIRELGFLNEFTADQRQQIQVTGGFILGEGTLDIDRRESGLHSRPDREIIREGCVLTPRNYKLSTAPLVASRVARIVTEGRA